MNNWEKIYFTWNLKLLLKFSLHIFFGNPSSWHVFNIWVNVQSDCGGQRILEHKLGLSKGHNLPDRVDGLLTELVSEVVIISNLDWHSKRKNNTVKPWTIVERWLLFSGRSCNKRLNFRLWQLQAALVIRGLFICKFAYSYLKNDLK